MAQKNRMKILVILIILFVGSLHAMNEEKICMTYLYGNFDYLSLLGRKKGSVNVISPSYFDILEDGSLKVNSISHDFVQKVHQENIKITPFISNHWNQKAGRNALENSETLINQIVAKVKQYELDGVNVDIENLTSSDRESYVQFVKSLREKMPKNKTVSVAVAANPHGFETGWQGSYDERKLAQYADYLVIMAYDEHYEGGPKGAVSSIQFLQKSVEQALTKVDKNKIVVGVPFYGRYWKEKEEIGGYGVTLQRIHKLIEEYESQVSYDTYHQNVVANIIIKEHEQKPIINGKKLSAGKYEFYYENESSMKEKVEWVVKKNLKGIAAWSLGQESIEVWDAFTEYMKPSFVKTDSEPKETTWAKDAISFVKTKGWMKGKSENDFGENEELTRAEFVTILARMMQLEVPQTIENGFWDLSNHWAKDIINTVRKTGLVEGYLDGSFRAEQTVTREEVAKVLSYFLKDNFSSSKTELSDVPQNRWSYQYIQKMVDKGVFIGYQDDTFKPQKRMTRAEIAMVLMRMNISQRKMT